MSIHITYSDDEYLDIEIYISPYKHFSEECWKRMVTLYREEGEIKASDWEYSPDNNSAFDIALKAPPLEVMQEYSRRYPDIIALITKTRLLGE